VGASTGAIAESHALHLALAQADSAEVVPLLQRVKARAGLDFINLRAADGALRYTDGGAAAAAPAEEDLDRAGMLAGLDQRRQGDGGAADGEREHVVVGDALGAMCAFMDEHPEVGALGPQMVYADGAPQPTRRRFPTPLTAFFESTWLQSFAPRSLLSHFYAEDLPANETVEVDWVVGAALLVRREVFHQVGGFDEGFFMYSEELDWCRRMRAAGWKVVHFPAARILHHEARSSAQVPAATHIRFNASKVRYFRKYHGAVFAEALRLFLLANFAVQLALEWLKGLFGHKRELRAARVAAYWQVLRSGLRSGVIS